MLRMCHLLLRSASSCSVCGLKDWECHLRGPDIPYLFWNCIFFPITVHGGWCIFNSIKPIGSWFLHQYVFMSMYFLCFTQESIQVNLHVHYCVTNSALYSAKYWISFSQSPHSHLQDLHLPLAYLQRLPGEWSGAGRAGKTSIGNPFVEKDRLRAFLKDPLLKELGNCSAWAGNDGTANRTLPSKRATI